jgi:hypothetical protein
MRLVLRLLRLLRHLPRCQLCPVLLDLLQEEKVAGVDGVG